jgi:hypothetical protein
MKAAKFLVHLLVSPLVSGFVAPRIVLSQKSASATVLKAEDGRPSRRALLQSAFVASALLSGATGVSAASYEYLEEPTEAFKENERKAMEFRKEQLAIKTKFKRVLDRLTNDSKSEQDIVDCLEDLKVLVQATGGLPVGLKKDEVIKSIRAKKKITTDWSTPMEISYKSLIREIEYQQSPNSGGSMEDKMNYSIN